MKRIITFNGRKGRYDVPSFLFTENEPLVIVFEIPKYIHGKYACLLTCGDEKHTFSLGDDMSVTVTPEFIKRGNFQPLSVFVELRTPQMDRVVIPSDPALGGYSIEPLYFIHVEEGTSAVAWCQDIETRIEQLKERVEHAESKLREFEDKGTPLTFED